MILVQRRAVILKRCAANIMKVYLKNEKKTICTEIFIHTRSLKYINIFLILYTKWAKKICICFTVGGEPKTFENH
jgi:uncharacterized membrane protein